MIAHLRKLGFNRLSLGVQDFDPLVQQAINRIQPLDMTASVMQAARHVGFHSDRRRSDLRTAASNGVELQPHRSTR